LGKRLKGDAQHDHCAYRCLKLAGTPRDCHLDCIDTVCGRNLYSARETSGTLHALRKTFHGLRPDAQGKLRLMAFVPTKHYATLNALEVVDENDHLACLRFLLHDW
jgi:hypothetical protein